MKLVTRLLLSVLISLSLVSVAQAGWNKYAKVSTALEANGFETLLFALDTTGLTPVLDANRVALFAPTNDVFDETAAALGCTDALDLATRLINIPVGDSNALVAVLSHHAVLGRVPTEAKLLRKKTLMTANGDRITSGVNSEGLYVLGAANSSPSTITSGPVNGPRWTIYPIDQILLPFAPPADLCS